MSHRRRSKDLTNDSEAHLPLGEMKDVLKQKAHELFALCDKEDKGFATKRDMYRLEDQLALTPEQLDEVFDALDKDGNGCLTLKEFTEGLGMFLGVECQLFQDDYEEINGEDERSRRRRLSSEKPDDDEEDEDDEKFDDFLDSLGAQNVFTDEEYIRHVWEKARKDDPTMFQNFQTLLRKITQELKNSKKEYTSLENTLKNRANDHEQQVQALYTEMEEQLQTEKERLLAQERLKEQQKREDLELELDQKNQELTELMSLHEELERKLEGLNACESEKKHENFKLQKERDGLHRKLLESDMALQEMRSQLELLRKKSLEEKRNRAKAALKVSEGIALERETMAQQLCELKKMNLKLLDEKDELEHSVSTTPLNVTTDDDSSSTDVENQVKDVQSPPRNNNTQLLRRAFASKSMGCTITSSPPVFKTKSFQKTKLHQIKEIPSSSSLPDEEASEPENTNLIQVAVLTEGGQTRPLTTGYSVDEDCEVDDNFYGSEPRLLVHQRKDLDVLQNNLNLSPRNKPKAGIRGNLKEDDEDHEEHLHRTHSGKASSRLSIHRLRKRHVGRIAKRTDPTDSRTSAYDPLRNSNGEESKENTPLLTPERVFKIVFVGDSGVGKSSFIHRFCHNSFRPTFSATVGLDFQVKMVNVDGRISALKLWDTAGQERFRSMTVQYFRHADGIIVVYDVTSETSFKNIRNWIFQVKEGVCENVAVMLIGNKMDLCKKDEDRVVRRKDGMKLAEEFGALFFETSSKTGQNVAESMDALSRLLQKKEDQVLQQVLQLQEPETVKKKKCC